MQETRQTYIDLLNQGRNDEVFQRLATGSAKVGVGEAAALNYLGVALQQSGRMQEAAQAYRQSAQLSLSDLLNCWNNLAGACYHLELFREAVSVAENLRGYHPFDCDLLALQVLSLIELGKKKEAEELARGFIGNLTRNPTATRWFIHAAWRNRKFLESLLMSSEIPPQQWDAGGLAHELLQCLAELELGDVAQDIFPLVYGEQCSLFDRSETWATAGILALSRCDLVATRAIYEEGMAKGFSERSATMNLSLAELAQGDYEAGWRHYMVRGDDPNLRSIVLPESVPRWRGEPVAGKTLVVSSEQGIGDMIQFVRFIPDLERLGARVIFASYPDVVSLLRNDPRAKTAEVAPLSVDEIDFYTLLLDLPHLLGVKSPADIPCQIPYLFANPDKAAAWKAQLASLPGLRIGLCWAGNPDFHGDHYRSSTINIFSSLAGIPGATFVGLQKGAGAKEAQCPPEGLPYIWIGDQFASFEDTAAAIANLDLVISTDTSIVHLAAALGKPVWLLLSQRSQDFRWVDFGAGNVWYPNVRAFRQEVDDDWAGLVRNKVRPALAQRLLMSLPADAAVWKKTVLQIDAAQMDWQQADWEDWAAAVGFVNDWEAAVRWLARQVSERDASIALNALVARLSKDEEMLAQPELAVAFARQQLKLGNADAALGCLEQVASTHGDEAIGRTGFLDWGWFYRGKGQWDLARDLWERGAAAFPRDGQFYYLRGIALWNEGKEKEALPLFQRAIECFPRHYKAHLAIAELLCEEKPTEAWASVQRAVMLKRHDVEAWQLVVRLFHSRGMYWLAERILLARCHVEHNFGSQLLRVKQLIMFGRLQEAAALLEQALMRPELPPTQQHKLALTMYDCGRREEALRRLDELAERRPESREIRFSLGFAQLRIGRCKEGWRNYYLGLQRRTPHFTEWTGEDLAGKSLLVIQDQGQGDAIQFFPLLRDIWAMAPKRLTLAVGRPLVTLFSAQKVPFDIVDLERLDWDDYRYDYQVDQMALPHLLDVDLLNPRHPQPTLIAPPGRVPQWQERLAQDRNLKVGIVWSGGDLFKANYLRSTALADWRVLWDIEGISFYSLQKDIHSNQAAVFERPLHNLAADCPTWLETLSVIDSLDLVITTCTAVAHAAGSINKPTWVVLSNEHVDFRWLEDREDSAWYPSVRLIRRQLGESWPQVFNRIAHDLVARYEGLNWRQPTSAEVTAQ